MTDRAALRRELNRIQKMGYAVDRGEEYENVWCVAAPLFQKNQLVGSLSVSDSKERISQQDIATIAKILLQRTSFISRQL